MIGISASVGKDGKNIKNDVALVQKLLNHKINLLPYRRKIEADGIVGPRTITRITQFQKSVLKLRKPDGRVDPNGRSIKTLAEGFEISTSVGKGGQNRRKDVSLIQELLNYKSAEIPLNPKLVVDGYIGNKTIDAIFKFQDAIMKLNSPDGRVDPNGKTFRALAGTNFVDSSNEADSTLIDLSEWEGDSSQWPEAKKLRSLNPKFKIKVTKVLAELKREGFKPKVFYAWRSRKVQMELYRKGHSKVRFSFHNATKPNGTPNAYAADIIDRRYAWSDKKETKRFWQALGKAAKRQGLYWGGDWRSFKDWAHVQFYKNSKLAEVKRQSGESGV